MKKFELLIDESCKKKIEKIRYKKIGKIISKWLNEIEVKGEKAGKLLNSKFHLYEKKISKPSLRLYYQIILKKNKAYIINFEIKKSKEKQNKLIEKIKKLLNV